VFIYISVFFEESGPDSVRVPAQPGGKREKEKTKMKKKGEKRKKEEKVYTHIFAYSDRKCKVFK